MLIIANCENQTRIMNQVNKFQYKYLENRLWELDAEEILLKFSTQYNGLGFKLDQGTWIVFNLYTDKIKAFYKKTLANSDIIYYQKILPKEEIIEWEFTYLDIIEKQGNKWEFRNK